MKKNEICVYSFGTQELLWTPKYPKELFWRQHLIVPSPEGTPARMPLIMQVDNSIDYFMETEEVTIEEEVIEKPIIRRYFISYVIDDVEVMEDMETQMGVELQKNDGPRIATPNMEDLKLLTRK